ncbi:hypothetical protein D9M69_671360 [compost metagenome]
MRSITQPPTPMSPTWASDTMPRREYMNPTPAAARAKQAVEVRICTHCPPRNMGTTTSATNPHSKGSRHFAAGPPQGEIRPLGGQ